MAQNTNDFMRGAIDTVVIHADEDCTGHTCYLSVGNKKECFVTVTHDSIVKTDTGSDVTFTLTQEDTLACQAGKFFLQMRTARDNVAAFATEWVPVTIGEAINKEFLRDVD